MIFLGEQIAEWKCHRPPPPVCLVINYVFLSQQGLLQKELQGSDSCWILSSG